MLDKTTSKTLSQRQILTGLITKSLGEKYSGSVLGFAWAVLNPFLIMLAVTFVFTKVFKTEIRNYPLLVLSSLLPWSFFSSSLMDSTTSFRKNSDVLNQFILSRRLIPLSITSANFINFIFGFIFMLPIFLVYNYTSLKYLLLLPVILILHFIFTLGLAFLFSIISVYFKDFSQFLNIGMMFLFWITPVFYPLEAVPSRYHFFIISNPATSFMELYRSVLYSGQSGDINKWLLAVLFSVSSLSAGYIVFASKESEIPKYI
jgi:lipopolysaccharide transport system permease protein